MTTLVCGAGGFIGGHIVGRLLADGHEVRAVDIKELESWYQSHPGAQNWIGDLRKDAECRRAIHGCDQVINLAADMGGMGFIETNKARCSLSVLINTHLLMAARDNSVHVSRFYFASSACIYPMYRQGDIEVTALREEDAYPALPEPGYGAEKLFSEHMTELFWDDHRLETRIGRYHNIFGTKGSWEGGREKAPAAVCRKVAEAKLSGHHEIEIWGDGQQTRSFCYVDDCVEGTLRLMASDIHEPLNIGSSELVSINELVSIVEDIAGVKLERRYNLDAPQGVRGRNSDNSKIKELLGWEPSIPLRAGLEETYAWVKEQVIARGVVTPGE